MEYQEWVRKICNKSNNFIIVGRRGSGKTVCGFRLLEIHRQYAPNRPLYAYKFPDPELLPEHITNIDKIKNLPEKCVLLLDESGIAFNQFSFRSDNSQLISNIMKVARHKDISLIFVSQQSATITRDVRRLTDTWILKEPSLSQKYDETTIIKELYREAYKQFDMFGEMDDKDKIKYTYVADTEHQGWIKLGVPEYWNDKISKAYKDLGNVPDVEEISVRNNKEVAQEILKSGIKPSAAIKELSRRTGISERQARRIIRKN